MPFVTKSRLGLLGKQRFFLWSYSPKYGIGSELPVIGGEQAEPLGTCQEDKEGLAVRGGFPGWSGVACG